MRKAASYFRNSQAATAVTIPLKTAIISVVVYAGANPFTPNRNGTEARQPITDNRLIEIRYVPSALNVGQSPPTTNKTTPTTNTGTVKGMRTSWGGAQPVINVEIATNTITILIVEPDPEFVRLALTAGAYC